MSQKVCRHCGKTRDMHSTPNEHCLSKSGYFELARFEPADDTGGERKPRFKVGDRVTWRGQEGMCFGTIKRQYKPENCDNYVLILDIGDDIEFPHGELNVEPAPSADGRQREIDISNLRFYARMFREYKWETDVLSWTVFEHTLKAIADRLAAPAPVSGEGRVGG